MVQGHRRQDLLIAWSRSSGTQSQAANWFHLTDDVDNVRRRCPISGRRRCCCVVRDHPTRNQFGHRVATVIIAVLAPAMGGMVLR
jgi:hypothetical protein